jgi:peroxiredoxin
LALFLIGAGLLALSAASLFLLLGLDKNPTSAEAFPSVIPVKVDFPAPELKAVDIDGRAVSLQDYAGKVILVNNWATWCPPCKAEMPVLQQYFEAHRQQNFILVAIEAGEPADQVAAFAKNYHLTFPVWVDTEFAALAAFKNDSLPSSYVIDSRGRVRLAWTGPVSIEKLEEYVTPLLEE